MTGAVYIHTRDRFQFLQKSLPWWAHYSPNKLPINLVVEPNEVKAHESFLVHSGLAKRIGVIGIKGKNKGMGNSRQVGFLHAQENGYKSMITTDDDCFPRDDPRLLLDASREPDILGIGGYFSMYGLLVKMKPNQGPQPIYAGLGFRCYALSIKTLKKLGGFPIEFKGYDDHEIARIGISRLHKPWYIQTDLPMGSLAKIGDPGGMCSLPGFAAVIDRKHTAHVLSHKNWPNYVTDPSRCEDRGRCSYTMQWKRFIRDNGIDI